jgi:hypothetical protein
LYVGGRGEERSEGRREEGGSEEYRDGGDGGDGGTEGWRRGRDGGMEEWRGAQMEGWKEEGGGMDRKVADSRRGRREGRRGGKKGREEGGEAYSQVTKGMLLLSKWNTTPSVHSDCPFVELPSEIQEKIFFQLAKLETRTILL